MTGQKDWCGSHTCVITYLAHQCYRQIINHGYFNYSYNIWRYKFTMNFFHSFLFSNNHFHMLFCISFTIFSFAILLRLNILLVKVHDSAS